MPSVSEQLDALVAQASPLPWIAQPEGSWIMAPNESSHGMRVGQTIARQPGRQEANARLAAIGATFIAAAIGLLDTHNFDGGVCEADCEVCDLFRRIEEALTDA